ncbi:MAG: long-chain fatty acid--CoA ligase [Anaerolineae bacterium]
MTAPTQVTYADKPWIKNYDPGIPAHLEYPDKPLHAFLTETARRVPAATALISSAKVPVAGRLASELNYRQLDELSDALAVGLINMGLKKGDRVAIIMPNTAAFVISFYAILKAGGVVAACNPTYPGEKMQYQINDCDAEIVICMSLFYNTFKSVQAGTKVKKVIVTNVKEYLPFIAKTLFTIAREKKDGHRVEIQSGDVALQDILKQYAGQKPSVEVTSDDIAIFQYTGGTTGVPKAAVSKHKALVANMLQLEVILRQFKGSGDQLNFLGAIPFFHVYGMVIVVALAAYVGGKVVIIPNARDIDEVVDCIDHFKPDLFPGVPALYNAINNHPRVKSGEASLKSLKFCFSGSAPLPSSVREEFERLSGSALREGFGMSETPTASHSNPVTREIRPKSIGLPLPDMEMKIVSLDDGITEVPVGEVGELLMHGPNMMIGYHGMPTETANALRMIDGKLWLYTGDIARMDEDGYFYIVDRKKDMALIGGFNVYPTEVEDALKSHPAVLEVGVAAIPNPNKEGMESLKAWVVRQPGSTVTEQELIDHCAKKLAPYAVPRRISFIAELPKTNIGKTLRRELVQMELEELKKQQQ